MILKPLGIYLTLKERWIGIIANTQNIVKLLMIFCELMTELIPLCFNAYYKAELR